jgi:hypothetical protein
MDAALDMLLRRLDHLSGELRELRDGVAKAVRIADDDPEMALTRARKVLEYVVRDVYRMRCEEDPGTRPLENLLQRLLKDGHLPKRLGAYANHIREMGNVGTHSYGEGVTKDDVRRSLEDLTTILEWYFTTVRPQASWPTAGAAVLPAPESPPVSPKPTAAVEAGAVTNTGPRLEMKPMPPRSALAENEASKDVT